jgi:hypothetical protein
MKWPGFLQEQKPESAQERNPTEGRRTAGRREQVAFSDLSSFLSVSKYQSETMLSNNASHSLYNKQCKAGRDKAQTKSTKNGT